MGRPQQQFERDGSPAKEFAFWLRDLRDRSGLTYQELSRRTHYATSTVQGATMGRRLPTWRVVRAIVEACGGDADGWRAYWIQIRRLIDHDLPPGLSRSVEPPWVHASWPDADADRRAWYVESFAALLRLDTTPIEAEEHRVIVAATDGLSQLATSVSLPRHPDADASRPHELDAELLHGGSLERREHPYESYFRNVIALPRPLRAGERHQYALRLRIPPGQPIASHYVHVPFRRSDAFELRVRFDPGHLPRAVWTLSGAPTAVIYERRPASETLVPDRFGEIHVSFRQLSVGLGYGVCWRE